jgi:transposase InsO family protein
MGEEDDVDDLLPLYTAAWGKEWEITGDCQRFVPAWKKAFAQIEKRGGGSFRNFVVENGLLHRRTLGKRGIRLRLCVPKELREEIMEACHSDKWSAHLGITRTQHRLEERYYWPRMAQNIRSYVRSCRSCQTRKTPPGKPWGLMENIWVARPFEKVGIDVLGPFPASAAGNVNVIVAVDYLTKWAEARAMKTATARDAAEFFVEEIVLRHGAPESVVTDCGKCFIADFTKQVMRLMEVDHRTTTPYHPQANGLVERLNHTLADMLSMYINKQHTNWDEILPYITFAYNSSRQESTGRSPFFLIYGREARLPVDVMMGVGTMREPTDAETMAKRLELAREEVSIRLGRVQEKQKERYDMGHQVAKEFQPGEEVLVYKPIRKVGRAEKLLHDWHGPYVVQRKTASLNYEVKQKDKRKTEIVHVGKMKTFLGSERK